MQENKKELWQVVKFTLFSISAGIIQVGAFALLEIFIKDYWIPYLISLLLSILWNFTLNRRYTFRSAANVPVAMAKILGFYAVFTPATMFGGQALVDAGWNGDLVNALTMLLNLVTEFLYQRFFVFGKSIDTAVKEKE